MPKTITNEERAEQISMKLAAVATEAKRLGAEFQEEKLMGLVDLSMKNLWIGSEYFRFRSKVWGGEVDVQFALKDSGRSPYGIAADVMVSWSSTGRSVAMAVATVALYQRAIEFAAYAEAIFAS